jgi:hypothetical protein
LTFLIFWLPDEAHERPKSALKKQALIFTPFLFSIRYTFSKETTRTRTRFRKIGVFLSKRGLWFWLNTELKLIWFAESRKVVVVAGEEPDSVQIGLLAALRTRTYCTAEENI